MLGKPNQMLLMSEKRTVHVLKCMLFYQRYDLVFVSMFRKDVDVECFMSSCLFASFSLCIVLIDFYLLQAVSVYFVPLSDKVLKQCAFYNSQDIDSI